MFFNNHLIFVGLRFLWLGLFLGCVYVAINFIVWVSKRNVYVYNLVTFCFYLFAGLLYSRFCISLYDYRFCWFGLLLMVFGMFLVKISINFFFTKFAKLLYNKFNIRKTKGNRDGKLQTNEKV